MDFEAIVQATDGFTGADLQALVYNANLEAVHETIDPGSLEKTLGKGKTRDDLDEDQKIQYVTFGPEGSEKTVLSAAEEMAIQNWVRCLMFLFWSDGHLRKCLTPQLKQIYQATSKRVGEEEKVEAPKPSKVRSSKPAGMLPAEPTFSRLFVRSIYIGS